LKKEKRITSVHKKTAIGFSNLDLIRNIKLDNNIISFYKLFGDGFTLQWKGNVSENSASVSVCIRLGEMKHIVADRKGIFYFDDTENPDLRNFHGLDSFIPEATCGINIDYTNQKQRPQIYYSTVKIECMI